MRRPLEQVDPDFGFTGWSEWDSVHYLLAAPFIRTEAAPFIDARRQSVNWTGLRRVSRSWGHGARLFVALAQNLWNSTGHPSVRELVDTLDHENFGRALRAIVIARGRKNSGLTGEPGDWL